MDESRLRAALDRLARQADGPDAAAAQVIKKGRGRIIRNVAIGALSVIVLVGGITYSAQDRSAVPQPADPGPALVSPSPTQSPAFAKIEGRVAFLSKRGPGAGLNIFVASGMTYEIVTETSRSSSRLSWSPSGKQIVFDHGLGPGQGSLVILDVDSGEEQVIIADERSGAPGLTPQSPAWSPDGKRIAFSSGTGDVYVMDLSDDEPELLISPPDRTCGYSYPAWSPDGSSIAFSNGCPGGGIHIVSAAGGKPRRVTDGRRDLEPSWSPDGSKIAFSAPGQDGRQIVVVEIEGRKPSVLTEEHDNYAPSWSPDGGKIVFGSNRSGEQNIWVMDADGSDELPVTIGRGHAIAPAWAPR